MAIRRAPRMIDATIVSRKRTHVDVLMDLFEAQEAVRAPLSIVHAKAADGLLVGHTNAGEWSRFDLEFTLDLNPEATQIVRYLTILNRPRRRTLDVGQSIIELGEFWQSPELFPLRTMVTNLVNEVLTRAIHDGVVGTTKA